MYCQNGTLCNENPIYLFTISTFMCLYVSDFYIPRIGPPIFMQQNRQTDRGLVGIYKSLTDTWMDWGRAIPFQGLFILNFRYCVFAMQHDTLKDHFMKYLKVDFSNTRLGWAQLATIRHIRHRIYRLTLLIIGCRIESTRRSCAVILP
jgi:hypothetical protein